MKSAMYVVYILLKGDGGVASIAMAYAISMCDCTQLHNVAEKLANYLEVIN